MMIFADPAHTQLLALGLVALILCTVLFTLVNRRELRRFVRETREADAAAVKARADLLDAFLRQQRERDTALREETKRAIAEIRAETKLAMESTGAAINMQSGRMSYMEDDRMPRLERRVTDLEGRMDRAEHPSLRPPR